MDDLAIEVRENKGIYYKVWRAMFDLLVRKCAGYQKLYVETV